MHRGLLCCLLLIPVAASRAADQVSSQTLQSISTPDKVDSRLGPLGFTDGAPDSATAAKIYDNLASGTKPGLFFLGSSAAAKSR